MSEYWYLLRSALSIYTFSLGFELYGVYLYMTNGDLFVYLVYSPHEGLGPFSVSFSE